MNRLNEALRARHTRSSGDAASFCFTGTVGEAIALLELAVARAPEAVPRIGRAVLLAKAVEIE